MKIRRIVPVILILFASGLAAARPESRGWIGLGYVYHQTDKEPAWLYVQRVTPQGPAEKAGIRPQDIITAIDGRPVPDSTAVLALFVNFVTGREIQFTVIRQHRTFTTRVKAIPLPPDRHRIWEANAALLKRQTAKPAQTARQKPPS